MKKRSIALSVMWILLISIMFSTPQLSFAVAAGKPGTPSIAHNNWDHDGNFTISMNMWWGNNGTSWKLYENGTIVDTGNLTDNTPNPQSVTINFNNKPTATYVYKFELTNSFGTSSSSEITVSVTTGSSTPTPTSHTTPATPTTTPSQIPTASPTHTTTPTNTVTPTATPTATSTPFPSSSPTPISNQKDMEKYTDKTAFIASDKDWRSVLSMVPAAVWSNGDSSVSKYPFLVYHEDEDVNFSFTKDLVKVFEFIPNATIHTSEEVSITGETSIPYGQTKEISITLTNHGNAQRSFSLQIPIELISLQSTEVSLSYGGNLCFVNDQQGSAFILQPGQSKSFSLDVTYDKKNIGFDAESIEYFNRQFGTQRVYSIGSIPSNIQSYLEKEDMSFQSVNHSMDFWTHANTVVYSEDQFETALIASTYASLINAPLIIKNFNDQVDLSGKYVIAVGESISNYNEKYTASQLQMKYCELTSTDKIILTHSDLSIKRLALKEVSPTGNTISQLYGKTSLLSPYLASARHELIIPVQSSQAGQVDAALENAVALHGISPEYLTIMASPKEIQQTVPVKQEFNADINFWSIDSSTYGNMDNDVAGLAELKVGRIYGFTVSDVSGYLARDLFYDNLENPNKALFVGLNTDNSWDYFPETMEELYKNTGYQITKRNSLVTPVPQDYADPSLIYLHEHGSPTGTGTIESRDIPELKNPFIIASSCLLGSYDKCYVHEYGELFAAQMLRKGCTGMVVAVDETYSNDTWETVSINEILNQNTGTVINHVNNFRAAARVSDNIGGLSPLALLGDPLFQLPQKPSILAEHTYTITHTVYPTIEFKDVVIDLQALKFKQGNTDYVFTHANYGYLGNPGFVSNYVKVGPINLFDNYTIEAYGVFPQGLAMEDIVKELAWQNEKDGTYLYLKIAKDYTGIPYDVASTDRVTIRFIKE